MRTILTDFQLLISAISGRAQIRFIARADAVGNMTSFGIGNRMWDSTVLAPAPAGRLALQLQKHLCRDRTSVGHDHSRDPYTQRKARRVIMTIGGAEEITDNPERHRYEIRVDGHLAGVAEYLDGDPGGTRTFTHTEVYRRFEGRGLGSRLTRAALDDARAKNLRVVPLCHFTAAFIRKNPEYRDLVCS